MQTVNGGEAQHQSTKKVTRQASSTNGGCGGSLTELLFDLAPSQLKLLFNQQLKIAKNSGDQRSN